MEDNTKNNIKKGRMVPEEQEEFIASRKEAFLSKSTLLSNSILYIILLLVVVGLIWSYFGKLEQITVGDGKVIPTSKYKTIQSLDGGIIQKIFVEEGDTVNPEQELVKLDDTRYRADYLNGYQKYLSILATIARLSAESQNKAQIDFPPDLKKQRPDLVATETNLFLTRREAGQKELAILQETLATANKELGMYKDLRKDDTVSVIEYDRAERNVNDIKEKILQKQAGFRESVLTELTQKEGELSSLGDQLASSRDKITRSTIRSPVYGVVKKLNINTVGGIINPGMDIMEIVPLSDTLLIETHIAPKDIAFIKVGQSAVVRVTAYDYTIYGDLQGKVEYISPDTVETQKASEAVTGDVNEKRLPVYYIVKVRTHRTYLGTKEHPLSILPGMQVTVHIITGEKTVMDYLLKPLLKAKTEALRER